MRFEDSAQMNLERAVLSTYVHWDDFFNKYPPQIVKGVFTIPFHKRLADVIYDEIENKRTLSIKMFQIQDSLKNPSQQEMWLKIIAQNPLTEQMLLDYMEVLNIKKIAREIQ